MALTFLFLDYQVVPGYSCGGVPINKWDDGSDAYWGRYFHQDLPTCKKRCSKYQECKGFVVVHSTGVCGHWKKGSLKSTEQYGKDRDCYMKIKGYFEYILSLRKLKIKNYDIVFNHVRYNDSSIFAHRFHSFQSFS